MRIFIVKLLLFFFTTQLFAQTNAELAKIDSLIKVGSCEVAEKLLMPWANENNQSRTIIRLLVSLSKCNGELESEAKMLNYALIANKNVQDIKTFSIIYRTKANNLLRRGLFNDAIIATKNALNYGEKLKDTLEIANAYSIFANIYGESGNFQASEYYGKKSIDFYIKSRNGEHFNNIATNLNLALLYDDLGQYTKALKTILSIKAVSEKRLPLQFLPDLYRKIGLTYSHLRVTDSADFYLKKSYLLDTTDTYTLNNLADLYLHQMKRPVEAREFLSKSIQIRKMLSVQDSLSYSFDFISMGSTYFFEKKYKMTEKYYQEAHDIRQKFLSKYHPLYIDILYHLGLTLEYQNNFKAAKKIYDEYFSLSEIDIFNNCFNLTESEKGNYFDKYHVLIHSSNLKNFISLKPTFLERIYNHELLIKSISLQTTQLMRNGIADSKDTVLIAKFDEYLLNRRQLSKWMMQPIAERPSSFKKVEEQTAQLEKELLEKSASFAETQSFWKTTWLDVKRQLLKDEAAIELVSFQDSSDVTNYAALVLTSTNLKPKWVKLGTQKQLDIIWGKSQKELTPQYQIENLYASPDLYRWFWQPLTKELNGIKNIYIAPVGGLHKINFGAIKVNNKQTVADLYSINRLLSTRELIRLKKEPRKLDENATLALFGDIDFDADSANIINQQSLILQPKREANTLFVENRAPLGEVFPTLFHTADEISMVDSIWQNRDTKIFKQAEANEFNIKHLPIYKILHIATHGFFFETSSKASTNDSTQHKNILLSSENPLMRAGLAFAGANKVWKGGRPYNDMEDGILTAQEVSDLNLVGNELVVLSACETALGTVDNNEGVYGLQRAFKMAGSKYILMSLWKVSDFHTKEMMILFYSALKTGKTIEQAYHFMQTQMQKKYANPFYWASFILTR